MMSPIEFEAEILIAVYKWLGMKPDQESGRVSELEIHCRAGKLPIVRIYCHDNGELSCEKPTRSAKLFDKLRRAFSR